MFIGLMCTPSLQLSDNSHQVNFSTEIVLMITSSQEYYLILKPLKELLSFHNPGFCLYFSECIVLLIPVSLERFVNFALVFSHLMTISFIANDKLFLCSLTDAFYTCIFMLLTHHE